MILAANKIIELVDQRLIKIEPYFDVGQLRPFGIRLHLANEILVPVAPQVIDLSADSPTDISFSEHNLRNEPIVLRPGAFVLGATVERIKLPDNLVCRLDGRSTLARLGILIHCTAEMIDGLYSECRSIVLEIANVGPFEISLPSNYGIGMLTFEVVHGEYDPQYEQAQYASQVSVSAPNLKFMTPQYRLP